MFCVQKFVLICLDTSIGDGHDRRWVGGQDAVPVVFLEQGCMVRKNRVRATRACLCVVNWTGDLKSGSLACGCLAWPGLGLGHRPEPRDFCSMLYLLTLSRYKSQYYISVTKESLPRWNVLFLFLSRGEKLCLACNSDPIQTAGRC